MVRHWDLSEWFTRASRLLISKYRRESEYQEIWYFHLFAREIQIEQRVYRQDLKWPDCLDGTMGVSMCSSVIHSWWGLLYLLPCLVLREWRYFSFSLLWPHIDSSHSQYHEHSWEVLLHQAWLTYQPSLLYSEQMQIPQQLEYLSHGCALPHIIQEYRLKDRWLEQFASYSLYTHDFELKVKWKNKKKSLK